MGSNKNLKGKIKGKLKNRFIFRGKPANIGTIQALSEVGRWFLVGGN
jgi:hypothetical protein